MRSGKEAWMAFDTVPARPRKHIHLGLVVASGAHHPHHPHHPIHCCVVNSCVHICCFMDSERNEVPLPSPFLGRRREG